MFEGFHQSPKGEFKPTFYNPFEIKHRKRTTKNQYKVLEKAFQENPKPSNAVRRNLAIQLEMSPRGVQVWFQNRRAKKKLQEMKQDRSVDSGTESCTETDVPCSNEPKTPNTTPTDYKRLPLSSLQRRFSVQPSSSSAKMERNRLETPTRLELQQVLDDICLPDHIYNPLQATNVPNQQLFGFSMSPPITGTNNSSDYFQPQVPLQRLVPAPQTSNFPPLPPSNATKGISKFPFKRSRANSCPNVHDTLPYNEIHSLLFKGSQNDNSAQPQKSKKQGKRTAPQKDSTDPPKRQRAISVPSIQWKGDDQIYFDLAGYYENNFPPIEEQNESSGRVELPQISQPLKYDDSEMGDPRKPRKNSGCSMNFLNSFINMGFIPENSNGRTESHPSIDPYYQAIMKGGKLGLHDMYLCDNSNTLETITEVDAQNYLSHGFMDQTISEVPWNTYSYAPNNMQAQFSLSDPSVDVNFDYLSYVNNANNDLLFHEDL